MIILKGSIIMALTADDVHHLLVHRKYSRHTSQVSSRTEHAGACPSLNAGADS